MSGTNLLKDEIIKGLNETSKYLLSHHSCEEYYKCLKLEYSKKTYYFCSRCLGIYIGLTANCLYYIYISKTSLPYSMIFLLPAFALIDWTITAFGFNKSSNSLRILSGFLLGIAYFNGVVVFFRDFPDYNVASIGVFYALFALILLYLKERKRKHTIL
jgi:uncharacterized membrane protein